MGRAHSSARQPARTTTASRTRIKAPGDRYVTDVEAGKWRVKLEDLLRARPDLADEVLRLAGMAPPY